MLCRRSPDLLHRRWPAPVPLLSRRHRAGAEPTIQPAAGGRTGPLAWGPMTPSRPAPPQYPTTATLMLLATAGDPFVQASARAGTAHRAITELLELLPADQQQLAEQFHPAARATWHAASVLSTWSLSAQEAGALASPTVASWGEAPMRSEEHTSELQ